LTRSLIVIAAICGLAYLGVRWMFPDDEAQIAATLHRIAEAFESSSTAVGGNSAAPIGGFEGIARLASLQEEFTVDVVVDAGPPFQQLHGRQSIVSALARANALARDLDVRFADIKTVVAEDRQGATSVVTAEARFADRAGERMLEAREFEVTFTRLEGRWLVAAVRLLQPLRRLETR
jgi:hypothetical protein